ncbi:hypothetical protein ABD91_25700 [Lysinibacillus sphaericus]|uniref:hypothetical protein n=1 Tax=Lysinibacillus sphaericus TaxID=1421 RepID=UPI0018CE987A|nr:hypothetical protein [Lysinibacillus sphaericus]MBG9694138.1 hypothetical protein [Lysinibacillus sphaericus]
MNTIVRAYDVYKIKACMFMMAMIAGVNYFFNSAWAAQPSNMHSGVNDEEASAAFDRFFSDWKMFLAFLSGLATLTCVLAFIVLMVKLASASDNIIERPKILREILVVLIVAALTGSATLVFALLTTGVLS